MTALLARLRRLLGPNPVARIVLTPDDAEAIEELIATLGTARNTTNEG